MFSFTQNAVLLKNRTIIVSEKSMPFTSDIQLTQREIDVLAHLANGLRPDQIADKMKLSIATINLHVQKAKRRLSANTREQAVALAIARQDVKVHPR